MAVVVTAVGHGETAPVVPLFLAYLAFYDRAVDPAAAAEYLAARVGAGDACLYQARSDDGEIMGFAQVYPTWSSLDLAPSWTLEDLYVSPEARRAGVGRALLDRVAVDAHDAGACRVVLETAHTNDTAQRLYERYGFVRDTEFRTYVLPLDAH